MANCVLSECGFRPLPSRLPNSRLPPNPSKTLPLLSNRPISLSSRTSKFWCIKVSAPEISAFMEEEKQQKKLEPVNAEEEREFDPGMPPPFNLAEIRASIPKHLWVKNPWKSMSYVVRDVAVVLGLAATAAYFNNWIVWPLYWAAQGTMFWALFVLGHDWYARKKYIFEGLSNVC